MVRLPFTKVCNVSYTMALLVMRNDVTSLPFYGMGNVTHKLLGENVMDSPSNKSISMGCYPPSSSIDREGMM